MEKSEKAPERYIAQQQTTQFNHLCKYFMSASDISLFFIRKKT